MLVKKLINDPDDVIEEMLEGIVGAHPRHLRVSERHPRAVVAREGPRPGKVGVVIGGGSGHEPAFVGYVGKGLADAAAIGNVFASPPPDPVLACTQEADGGAGVVYLYGNYAGDVMNFDMAAELAGLEDIAVRTVLVTDDVASAPVERREERRGVAGDFFVFKAAGAAADLGHDLEGVVRAAEHANARCLTMGVALGPCSLPQTRRPNFDLGEDEMEIGMGIHGEPGVERGKLETADAVAGKLLDRVLGELRPARGDRVQVLVNGLGATPPMELYLLHRAVARRLKADGVAIAKSYVGEYVTSLDMAGASITVIALDDELEEWLNHPCDCAMFHVP